MKNYTIEVYGWTLDAKAKSISAAQIEKINALKNDFGADTLSQIKFEIEDTIVLDEDWDIFNISKPFWYLDKTVFVVKDEENIEVNRFQLSSIIHHSDFGSDDLGAAYVVIPGIKFDNILFSVDALKGGVCVYKIQSKDLPKVTDFSVLDGSIEGSEAEWEFIDTLYHKGTKLEINSYLDSDCKSSDMHLYSN